MDQSPNPILTVSPTPNRRVRRLIILLILAVPLWYVGSFVRMAYRSMQGEYGAADYVWLKGFIDPAVAAELPASIPPDARFCRVFAPGIPWAPMSTGDYLLEVRMDLPPNRARTLAAEAAKRQDSAKSIASRGRSLGRDDWENLLGYASLVSRLHTASARPLPASFQSFVLYSHRGDAKDSIVGVSVDVDSGEVIYWVYVM